MCGIFCVLNSFCNNCDNLVSQLIFEANIKNRGPDSFNFKVLSLQQSSLAFASSVLWLQGQTLSPQPIEDPESVFCYNGDIFSGLNDSIQKEKGDTHLFHSFLKEHISSDLLNGLGKLHGPYAFIFFDKTNNKLYFARDRFGRRSLLLGRNEEGDTLVLTSVAKRNTQFRFIEIPSIGVFCFDVLKNSFEVDFWPYKNKNFYTKLKELEAFLKTDISIARPASEGDCVPDDLSENANLVLLRGLKQPESLETYTIFTELLNCPTWKKNVYTLRNLLENAVQQRLAAQPEYCKSCIAEKKLCKHATTGILFSGGVDCAVLASLCDQYVDKQRPIDLLNVSFEEAKNYQSPDRVTGLETLEELKALCPHRDWNFVEINVTKESLDQERDRHIADLIYPLNTILDDSLGCALWFASKGQSSHYVSSARILIVGMGADELFGGYRRHRTAFKRYSWKGLQESLDDDWMNLPYRNLGRDDRAVSDHGRQLRTPYLDENVVDFVRELPSWEKTYPTNDLPEGFGEKILLRSLAYELGLRNAATLKKRALQFGSRIANPKENGKDISPRLDT
ncbi:asparagine synthetase domain-containing protein CG17486 [Dendroctonus ponderosae]|uniref:Asparagine synthetase [glutamine-hydrolyzing] n=1 Tax=Dendroctonus ponderosae TaxID=77166 RepID=A0AAR5PAV3_DENPD|nr:asparagine synthetase domain-containing protein CG17486 [Dendroctonus ponderosae]KAH1007220.1 hypothetical protein HUJ04_004485 [Dendroctonus ponderosae]KAH1014695.1 hypothetical protein HUJ05_012537 [Dendroctonus ponderosae]